MVSRRFMSSLLLVVTVATPVDAQPSAGASLPNVAHVGDHVVVMESGGRETRGIVRAVSETSITVNGRVLDVQRVHTIRQTDSLANGTWTGIAVGLGVSVAAVVRCGRFRYSEQRGLCLAAGVGSGLLTVPVGAFLGRDIDRARGDREVYRRHQSSAHVGWTPGRATLDVAIAW